MSTTDVVPQCECVLAAQIDFLLNYEEIKRKNKQIEFKVIVIWRTCNIHIIIYIHINKLQKKILLIILKLEKFTKKNLKKDQVKKKNKLQKKK